jgi:hypothetical protein
MPSFAHNAAVVQAEAVSIERVEGAAMAGAPGRRRAREPHP